MWKPFKDALAAHCPETRLKGPASDDDLALLRNEYGELPPGLEALWSEHAGSTFFGGEWRFRFLSPTEALEVWRTQRTMEADDEVEEATFEPHWLAIAGDADDTHVYCLDKGRVVLVHWIEGRHEHVTESLTLFLRQLADELNLEAKAVEDAAAADTARKAAKKAAHPILTQNVADELARYRRAGVDLGSPGDLEPDPVFAIGQGTEWTPATYATRQFLDCVDGFDFRGLVTADAWADYVTLRGNEWSPGLGTRLAEHIRGPFDQNDAPKARGDVLAHAAAQFFAELDDPRRLWPLAGKGTPYFCRYALLTVAQKSALEAARLVQFREFAPENSGAGSGGLWGKIKRMFGES